MNIDKVRQAIYETYRDRNPTLETAETGPRWSLEPDYRQEDFTAMAEAAVAAMELTQERRVDVPWSRHPVSVNLDASTPDATSDERRWVTPWQKEDDQ